MTQHEWTEPVPASQAERSPLSPRTRVNRLSSTPAFLIDSHELNRLLLLQMRNKSTGHQKSAQCFVRIWRGLARFGVHSVPSSLKNRNSYFSQSEMGFLPIISRETTPLTLGSLLKHKLDRNYISHLAQECRPPPPAVGGGSKGKLARLHIFLFVCCCCI